jgi:hypothetical protein
LIFFNDLTANQMLIENSFQDGWRTGVVPDGFRIDDGNGAFCAETKAVRLGTPDMKPVGIRRLRVDLLNAPLQVFPGEESFFVLAAFCVGLVAAQKDMAAWLI